MNVGSTGGGLNFTAGATWSNSVSTTVPPLVVNVGNTVNQGVFWQFNYCTAGPDGTNTNCIGTIQPAPATTCQDQLGSPQNGQTQNGKFSNAVQTVHWQAQPDTRVSNTFDIKVQFISTLAYSEMRLWSAPDFNVNIFCSRLKGGTCKNCFTSWCNCQVQSQKSNDETSFTFMIPLPSNDCVVPTPSPSPPPS